MQSSGPPVASQATSALALVLKPVRIADVPTLVKRPVEHNAPSGKIRERKKKDPQSHQHPEEQPERQDTKSFRQNPEKREGSADTPAGSTGTPASIWQIPEENGSLMHHGNISSARHDTEKKTRVRLGVFVNQLV